MGSDHSARQTTETGERHAMDWTGPAFTELQRRIRALVDDLRRGVLDAITKASAAEIAELVRTANLSPNPPRVTGARAAPSKKRALEHAADGEATGRRSGRQERHEDNDREATPASLSTLQDPFDITSPGELLASTQETRRAGPALGPRAGDATFSFGPAPASSAHLSSSFNDMAQSADATSVPSEHGPGAAPPAPLESAVALPASDREAESERRPRIVLREGERLLSATGSGVVIRRERRVSPPR